MLARVIAVAVLALSPASSSSPVANAGIEVEEFEPAVETEQSDWTDWGTCAGHTAMAAVVCSFAFPMTCIASTMLTACECVPLILDDFAEYSCPGLG